MENNERIFSKEEYFDWINKFEENFKYYNPGRPLPGETTESFPIIAGGAKYENTGVIPKANLIEVKNCGFNVCSQGSMGAEGILQSLINAREVGIRITTRNYNFIHYPIEGSFCGNVDGKYTCKYSQYVAGIFVFDEPTYNDLMGQTENGLRLMEDYQILMNRVLAYNSPNNSYDPPSDSDLTLQCYLGINLVGAPVAYFMPNPDSWKDDPGYEVYLQYLETFQHNFKPSYFSYDLYPISERAQLLYEGISPQPIVYDGTEGDISVDFYRFYKTAEVFSDFSSKHDRPFWAFCQGTSFMNIGNFKLYRPHALEQYLRYEAFTAIAYGAKAIQYWNYVVSTTNPNGYQTNFESYFSALTNRKDQKTASWYYARKINREIKKYEQIFINSTTIKILEATQSNSFKYSKLTHNIEISTNNDKGILISELSLKNSAVNYFLIVSKDVLHYQRLSIKVSSGKFVELTPEVSLGEENKTLEIGTQSRILVPGGYRIIEVSYAAIGPVFPPV